MLLDKENHSEDEKDIISILKIMLVLLSILKVKWKDQLLQAQLEKKLLIYGQRLPQLLAQYCEYNNFLIQIILYKKKWQINLTTLNIYKHFIQLGKNLILKKYLKKKRLLIFPKKLNLKFHQKNKTQYLLMQNNMKTLKCKSLL